MLDNLVLLSKAWCEKHHVTWWSNNSTGFFYWTSNGETYYMPFSEMGIGGADNVGIY